MMATAQRQGAIIVLPPPRGATLDSDLTRGFDPRLLAQTEWVIRVMRERVGQ
jgi:hypothetical protein